MTAYPLDFYRRSERKWALRAQAASARESTGRSEGRDILGRSPWLREIGRCLRVGYDAVDHPVPEHLAALLKKLKGR